MRLDHFTIRTSELEAMKDFFCEIVELDVGDRPPFDFNGYWLYERVDGRPVVHLIGDDSADADDTGALDHMAFQGEPARYDEVNARIEATDYKQDRRIVPRDGMRQIFITGPQEFLVELNFPAEG